VVKVILLFFGQNGAALNTHDGRQVGMQSIIVVVLALVSQAEFHKKLSSLFYF
jgi:hypothetical protein